MVINYNGTYIQENEFSIGLNDRAFQYGDGLFETIVVRNGKIKFLSAHIERLKLGSKAIDLNLPELFSREAIELLILELIQMNKLTENVRVKLMVWRKEGGLYTPENDSINYLIKTSALTNASIVSIKSWRCYHQFRLTETLISAYKTINALPYVLASNYKKQHKLDEVVLLDQEGNVAEASASNLFWIQDNDLFTPSLKTGCKKGIIRSQLQKIASQYGYSWNEVLLHDITTLQNSDVIFVANVCGVGLIKGEFPFGVLYE
jgi:branched-chain amino acid aminotransferase/4-amino-4-deoxychorismate lyase